MGLKQSAVVANLWEAVPMGPPDATLGVSEAFKRCEAPEKMNLGVGAYRDDNGKPFVLPSVREAERQILEAQMDHEYLGITGLPSFTAASAKLALADAGNIIADKRNITTQAISGTGALRVGSASLPMPAMSWAPSPTMTRQRVVSMLRAVTTISAPMCPMAHVSSSTLAPTTRQASTRHRRSGRS